MEPPLVVPASQDKKKRARKHRTCQAPGCVTQCNFGFPGSRAEFCFLHKLEGQRNVNHRLCQAPSCQRLANFACPGERAKFCGEHKLPNQTACHRRPVCEYPGCCRQPVFGYPGQPRRSCSAHRKDGMESKTVVRRCRGGASGAGSFGSCGKSASFNFPQAGAKADYCEEHSSEGMVSLRARTCQAEGCSKRASFSLGPGASPTSCAIHQKTGMIDTKRKACEEANCRRAALPNSGSGGGSGADGGVVKKRRCKQHTAAAAAPVTATSPPAPRRRRQSFTSTNTDNQLLVAAAATEGEAFGGEAWAAAYRDEEAAAGAREREGEGSSGRGCEHPGCLRDPVFAGHADPVRRPRFCLFHRTDALVDVSLVRCGDSSGCESIASWGYFGEQAARCGAHRLPQMVDVKARRCRRRGCSRVPYFAASTAAAAAAAAAPAGEGAMWCSLHKGEGMLDVKSQRCSAAGCDNLPLDNSRGDDSAPTTHCREHGPHLPSSASSSSASSSSSNAVAPTWGPASAENADTGFASPVTDADTAEAATVVASLWADDIGGDWDFGGVGSSGGTG
ncbi:unnamed protein product, partial [Scytosiphon promiscuus]